MFQSLRSKLVASYCLIIFLCLLLAGSGSAYFLREYQRQIKLNQLSDLALPISWQVQLLERVGASRDQIASFLQDRSVEMDVRILLLDSTGTVLEDTSNSLQGTRLAVAVDLQQPAERFSTAPRVVFAQVGRQGFVFINSPGRPNSPSSERFAVRTPFYSVVLAVPEQSLTASWLELSPSLAIAALVSLVVSIGASLLLSRSISRPVTQVTRAAEEMARGNYDQHVPHKGNDEVGRLAEAFNNMARQVTTSNRTLRDFLANVSHDLRTPLTSVQGFSQAMVDGTITRPEEYAEAAQIINEESGRMRQMVEDLLLLSKIESGQMPMDRKRLDLYELLRACVRRVTPQAQQAGIFLDMEAGKGTEIVGDETRLEQLFGNLLDNALNNTPFGGSVMVRLSTYAPRSPTGDGHRTESSIPGARGLQVTVHNTGSYVPPEDQERIFERFYQVDKSRARDGEGTGLGLAIAREIAHAHGGTISVRSGREEGTTFVLAFAEGPR